VEKAQKRLVGLNIGAASVKAVELSSKGGEATLVSMGQQPLAPDAIVDGQVIDSEEVANAIAKVFDDNQIKTEQVATAVGGYSVILKHITVPLMSDEEWEESCDWHAEEHIPFDMSDVFLDTQILDRSEYMQALIAASKRDAVANRKLPIEAAGKQVSIVDAEPLALANCYLFNYEPEDDAPVALLDIGAASSAICIMRGRRSEFMREMSFGGDAFTQLLQKELGLSFEQAEEAKRSRGQEIGIQGAEIEGVVDALSKALSLEALISSVSQMFEQEITRTFDFYRATCDEPSRVEKILISGGGSKLNGLIEFLSSKLEVQVERLDPFRRIKFDERSFSREQLNEVAPEMAIAVGLALRGVDKAAAFVINLLAYDEKKVALESARTSKGEKTYRFKGRNRTGDLVVGTRVAKSREDLKRILGYDGITLVSNRDRINLLVSLASRYRRRERVSAKELERFTRWFAFMINSGLPIMQSLYILSAEGKNEYFKETLSGVVTRLEEGSTLSAAIERYPKVFDRHYANMIEAGENGGILDLVLTRLVSSLERTLKWRHKVRLALLYPLTAFALLLLIAVIAFTSRSSSHRVNLLTRIFASAGTFLTGIGGAIVVAIILVAIISLYLFYKTERGRQRIDKLLLRAPVFGQFLRQQNVARFARMFSTLLSTGCPILESLDTCAENTRNVVFKDAIYRLRYEIECGRSFSDGMTNDDAFSELDRTAIGIGEQTGALDAACSRLADFYEQELDTTMAGLPLLVAPFFIALCVLIIGLVFYYR
jgi:type IV pilus assembly protein PilM